MKFKKLLLKHWLPLLFLLVFLLRLPCLFEPFTYGDEGIYLTLGQAARKGLVWYRDIHDNKPPMLYLMATLAGNFTAYRLLHFFWSFLTLEFFYLLAKKIFPKNQPAVILSTFFFGILSALHSFESNIGNAENFMALPTILAFWLVWDFFKSKKPVFKPQVSFFSAGLLLSIAALFKVPAAFDFGAAFLITWLFGLETKKKNIAKIFFHSLSLIAGFALPILFSFVYYDLKGALKEYWVAAFAQNLPYLSSWGAAGSGSGGLPWLLLGRFGLVGGLVLVLFFFRKKISSQAKLILFWFGFAWLAALLSSRPYPHYLIQIIPAFSLSLGLFFPTRKKYLNEVALPLVLAVVFRLTFILFQFWNYPNWPYLTNFYQYALGIKSKQAYWQVFDPSSASLYETAAYLRGRTSPDEKIFVWGTKPSLYPLTNRLPLGRYSVSYHIIDFDGYQTTMEKLEKTPPRYLLVSGDESRPFPAFFAFLQLNYSLEKEINGIKIYHHVKN